MLNLIKLAIACALSVHMCESLAGANVKHYVNKFWLFSAPYVTFYNGEPVADYSKKIDTRSIELLSKAGKNIWPISLNMTDDEHKAVIKSVAKVGILEAQLGLRFEERSTGGRTPTYYMRIRRDHCAGHWMKHIKRKDSKYTSDRLKELPAAKILYNYCMENAHMAVIANPSLRRKHQL